MFFQDAEIHHDEDARLARLLGGLLVDDIFLHPDRRDFKLDGLVDDLFHEFRTPENVDDVDLPRRIFLWNIEQRRVSPLAEAPLDSRVDGNDAISVSLHVGADAVTGAQGIRGESDDGDCLGSLQ